MKKTLIETGTGVAVLVGVGDGVSGVGVLVEVGTGVREGVTDGVTV